MCRHQVQKRMTPRIVREADVLAHNLMGLVHHVTGTPAIAGVSADQMTGGGTLAFIAVIVVKSTTRSSVPATPARDVSLTPAVARVTADNITRAGALTLLPIAVEDLTSVHAGACNQCT